MDDNPNWRSYKRYSPRTARGGIKSQQESGFGKNWWARRWNAVLGGFDIGTRLVSGRYYARVGQVLSIEIKQGRVQAVVQGSRPEPYDVEIRVKTLPPVKWFKLSKVAFKQALVAGQLLAGEMPEDMEKIFQDSGVSLFPERADDLQTSCSCPDRSNPCKHIAAVYYLLGEEFDRDPFLIFLLRGMGRKELLGLISGSDDGERGGRQAAPKPVPLPNKADLFWAPLEPPPDFVGPVLAPAVHANLPKTLGNLPFWRGSDSFTRSMESVYRKASESAIIILAQED